MSAKAIGVFPVPTTASSESEAVEGLSIVSDKKGRVRNTRTAMELHGENQRAQRLINSWNVLDAAFWKAVRPENSEGPREMRFAEIELVKFVVPRMVRVAMQVVPDFHWDYSESKMAQFADYLHEEMYSQSRMIHHCPELDDMVKVLGECASIMLARSLRMDWNS